MAQQKKELSAYEKELRSFLTGKPTGSLLYIAERAMKLAIIDIDDYNPEQSATLRETKMGCNSVRSARKASYEARLKAENAGNPEIELPNQSTSADGGKIA
jgi:hypothetical protein